MTTRASKTFRPSAALLLKLLYIIQQTKTSYKRGVDNYSPPASFL